MTNWDALAPAKAPSNTLRRLWRVFTAARCVVAALLLALLGLAFALDPAPHRIAIALSAAYLALSLAVALALVHHGSVQTIRSLNRIWLSTIGLDLVLFTTLQGLRLDDINFTPLFALPVLMGAVLGSARVALGTTTAATLLVLGLAGGSWLWRPAETAPRWVQAALTGVGLFFVALVAHEMARRLQREEALTQHNRRAAQMQARVNDLVIEALSDGVLVIDSEGRVHAANPAADAILGQGLAPIERPFALSAYPAWVSLASLAERTFTHHCPQSMEIPLAQTQGAAREVRVRTQLTRAPDPHSESLCVMFLQDRRELEARIRTEKLAAMGRLSAAVAHEIRNPLAAIAQASALLAEDLSDPSHQQLTTLVQQNARRLSRIVDDILNVARARQSPIPPGGEALELDASVRALTEEWALHAQRPDLGLKLHAPHCHVRFDIEHLRRILVNLLDNAAHYANGRDNAIHVTTQHRSDRAATLQVWSAGAPLEPTVQQHLFEPFFSSESRSSGLGLFLCRELCEQHGARISYQRQRGTTTGPEGNAFIISFATHSGRLTQ